MSARVEVLVEWNGDEVKRRARTLIGKSTWHIGLAVLSDAKVLCPVRYGYLAASLMAAGHDRETELDMPSPSAGVGESFGDAALLLAPESFRKIAKPGPYSSGEQVHVGTAVDYGPHVEFGTVRSEAQPFLRPALDMAQGKVPTIVRVDGKLAFKEYLR